jgi:hypothetical protein
MAFLTGKGVCAYHSYGDDSGSTIHAHAVKVAALERLGCVNTKVRVLATRDSEVAEFDVGTGVRK